MQIIFIFIMVIVIMILIITKGTLNNDYDGMIMAIRMMITIGIRIRRGMRHKSERKRKMKEIKRESNRKCTINNVHGTK